MKSGSYLKKEHAYKITVGTPGKKPATKNTFDVKLSSPFSSSGTYRVFIEQSDLYFIQLNDGSRSILEAVAPLLGPVGALISLVFLLFSKRKTKEKLKKIAQENPEDLLREGGKSFKLYLAEIRDAAIEPPSFFTNSNIKVGRLNLTVRHGEKIKTQFTSIAEMNDAIRLLGPPLSSTLKINAEWNKEKQRFQKKK